MTYSIVISYDNGFHEICGNGLSYSEAINAIEELKADDLAARQSGIPVANCRYWIKKD